jgi:hypothetical protein
MTIRALPGSTSKAWDELFRVLPLRERLRDSDVATITADDIKSRTGREPRLMTKFDTRESRPRALNDVTILPSSNGAYALLRGDGYCDLRPADSVRIWSRHRARSDILTLPWVTGPASESQALDMAFASGILDDFFQDRDARLTIRGRLRCPAFRYAFQCASRTVELVADGVQIEVDSGFEGERVYLLEAKLGNRSNFHVRQLYFPLRMWSTLVASKPVIAAYLAWSNRRITLRSFRFDPIDLYQSIQPVASVDYLLDEPDRLPSLTELIESTPPYVGALQVPFPQADDMHRVIDIVDAIGSGVSGRAALASRYGFDGRQADYYANAAAFLGLLERDQRSFRLSPLGHQFVAAPLDRRHEMLLRQIVARPVLRQVAVHIAESGALPPLDAITEIVASRTGLSRGTPQRRAKTVLSWFKWVRQVVEPDPLSAQSNVEANGQCRLF